MMTVALAVSTVDHTANRIKGALKRSCGGRMACPDTCTERKEHCMSTEHAVTTFVRRDRAKVMANDLLAVGPWVWK